MSAAKTILAILIASFVGFVVARVSESTPVAERAPTATRERDVDELRVEMARMRSEISARPRVIERSVEAPAVEPAVDEPAHDQIAAHDRAKARVASALSARRWTAADAAELRADLVLLTGDQRMEVLRSLTVAINREQITLEGDNLL